MENWTGVKVVKPQVGRHVLVWGVPEHYTGPNTWTKAFLGEDGLWREAHTLEIWTVYSWMIPQGPAF